MSERGIRVSGRIAKQGKLALIAVCFFATCAGLATAEHTRRWRQSTYDEFLKGTTRGIAVRSDGRLELAPKFTQLADADASYLWALKLDSKGTLYASGGSPAKVFRLDANGKAATVFESNELSAQAIAFDAKGTLYVATSPDGKVYRVSSLGEKSVFFDAKTKYIWDIAFGPDGVLYVATGDKGQIFSVAPDGKSEVFYASDEAHIRVLTFDGKGNLIVGTEPSGRVLRLTKAKGAGTEEGVVLYENPKRELTDSAEITDVVRISSGKIFLVTANPGKLRALGPEYEPEGTYESRSFDTQLFSQWGRVEWWSPPAGPAKNGSNNKEPSLEIFVRSGNTEDPGKEWSKWHGPYSTSGAQLDAPAGRFGQG